MPKIGEIAKGTHLGLASKHKFIWHACVDCGKERWATLRNGSPRSLKCRHCNSARRRGSINPHWKGGKHITQGYVFIWVDKSWPFYESMTTKSKGYTGYILEHRYIMANHLGRSLLKVEQVHHKNGIRNDNRIENLELISLANHTLRTVLCKHCELQKEIRLLRWQIKELNRQLQLKLDATKFEKIAKTESLPFVIISEEPTATISKDLSKMGSI